MNRAGDSSLGGGQVRTRDTTTSGAVEINTAPHFTTWTNMYLFDGDRRSTAVTSRASGVNEVIV